jgi:hypothetical protein
MLRGAFIKVLKDIRAKQVHAGVKRLNIFKYLVILVL